MNGNMMHGMESNDAFSMGMIHQHGRGEWECGWSAYGMNIRWEMCCVINRAENVDDGGIHYGASTQSRSKRLSHEGITVRGRRIKNGQTK